MPYCQNKKSAFFVFALTVSTMLCQNIMPTCLAALADISQLPIDSALAVKPNVIFGIDDSGSMDFEVLLDTNDGRLWYDEVDKTAVDSQGNPLFNDSGDPGSSGGHNWSAFVYLFPNGTNSDARVYNDAFGMYAVPPIGSYAFLRSPDYNKIYYNPNITYKPWSPAYVSGAVKTFANAVPTAARSHPVFPTSGTAITTNLTATQTTTTANYTFRMLPGMVIPGASIANIQARQGSNSWNTILTNRTVLTNEDWEVNIPYYPATYYLKDATCTTGTSCFTAPDGAKLRRYEIKVGVTFPSGRNYTDELQNFANWFTYYRKRKLLLSAAMGEVLPKIKTIRAGMTRFNSLSPVSMLDFDNLNADSNYMKLLGDIYTTSGNNTTPTRATLDYIGKQYQNNASIIQKACQVNAAMIVTDGFANASGPNAPGYTQATYGNGAPYTTIYPNSLADLALAYYTLNLKPSLTPGLVPVNLQDTTVNSDKNSNLHMNTYALTMVKKGLIYGSNTPAALNPFTSAPAWTNPNIDRHPSSVDDLWHATINGRGRIFDASNPVTIASSVTQVLGEIIAKARAGSAVALNDLFLGSTNNAVYSANHHLSYGDLERMQLDLTNGSILTSAPTWSAMTMLDAKSPSNRLIATSDSVTAYPFVWANLPIGLQSQLNSTLIPPGPVNGQIILQWVRGDKTLDATLYRARDHILGSIVNADPVLVKGARSQYTENNYGQFKTNVANRTEVVYQAANDGMLHAFSAATGDELWSYIPSSVLLKLPKLARTDFIHEFTVDGTPTVGDFYDGSSWRTLLVGGLRAGGNGYYALNVTTPDASTINQVTSKFMWEFPNSSTPAAIRNEVGLTFGKPLIIKTTAAGWVVLLTSGYNNTGGGKGHVYVLDAKTGTLLKDLSTNVGSSTTPSGLAQIAAYSDNPKYDPLVKQVYGGDLLGNVWRFDFSGSTIASWNVTRLATLVDANGLPQPITAEVELAKINNKRMVLVGTGKLLGATDYSDTTQQTLYGLYDDETAAPLISPLRSNLISVNNSSSTGTKGWYIDLQSAGERVTGSPVLVLGQLIVNTNKPSTDGCLVENYQYLVELIHPTPAPGDPVLSPDKPTFTRRLVGATFAAAPTVVVLPGGKVVIITHKSDDTFDSTQVTQATSTAVVSAVGWREVIRD